MKRLTRTIILVLIMVMVGTASFATQIASNTIAANNTSSNNQNTIQAPTVTRDSMQAAAQNSLQNRNQTANALLDDEEDVAAPTTSTTNTIGATSRQGEMTTQSTNATTMKSVNEVSTASSNPDFGISELLNVIIIAIGLVLILLSVAILIRLK